MDDLPESILLKLSVLLLVRSSAISSDNFDDLFTPYDFNYVRAREKIAPSKFPDFMRKIQHAGPNSDFHPRHLFEQLLRAGYPDYAAKAQEFFRVHTPELLR